MRRGLWLGAGAVAIVVVAAIVFMTRDGTPPAQKMAAAPAAPPAAKPAPTPAEPGGTSFDIVKIDPTGHAVIAGRAAPGAKVHLSDGDKPLGDVTADFRGEWVLVPDRPLPPGQHKIGLEATDPKTGARQTASDTVALVVAPPASPNASVAVLLPAKGDRPAQVLQQPGGAPAAGALSIDTAEADDKGNLAVAGHGAPGAAVTIYGGDQKLGTATADPSGKWALAAPLPEQGKGFDLRAEIPGANGAQAQRVTEPYAPPTEAMAVPAGDSYTVKPGNNLWFLARNSYGAGTRYTMIYQANRGHIRDPDLIYPGQVFLIPKPQ